MGSLWQLLLQHQVILLSFVPLAPLSLFATVPFSSKYTGINITCLITLTEIAAGMAQALHFNTYGGTPWLVLLLLLFLM